MTNSNHIPDSHRNEALESVPAEERVVLNNIWDLVANADETPVFSENDIDETWQQIASFARADKTTRQAKPRLRLVSSRPFWISMAASVLIGAIGLGWWLQPVEFYAPPGEQLSVNLPDGSTVELNSGSLISYSRSFSSNRQLQLTGEAYFDVASSKKPFTVTTFNAKIKVLGTKFNVKAWQKSILPETAVNLREGSVLFSPAGQDDNGVIMKPGERRSITTNTSISPPDTLTDRTSPAWINGDLLYKDEWLGVILEDLERKFDVDIDLKASNLLNKEFTFVYHKAESADPVIEILSKALNLRYSETTRGYIIYPEKH